MSLPYIWEKWSEDEWHILMHQPHGPERVAVAVQLIRMHGAPEMHVLLDLFKQNDRDILSLIARTPSAGEIICDLISQGRDREAELLFQLARGAKADDGRKNSSLANLPCAGAVTAHPTPPVP